jgi:hypothetical protein
MRPLAASAPTPGNTPWAYSYYTLAVIIPGLFKRQFATGLAGFKAAQIAPLIGKVAIETSQEANVHGSFSIGLILVNALIPARPKGQPASHSNKEL